MKKIAKLLFASAALLAAFVSCQKVEEISEAPKTTHIVRFTTEMPTKTSYTVEGTTVNYKWEESDLYRLHVYEDGVEGTIIVDESAIDETYVRLTVSFEGEDGNSHTYTANLNGGVVKSEQVADGKYDSDCDVLVAKPVQSSELGENGAYTFQFRRPVAITELKLKSLKADEKVSKVTIISDSEHPIAGKYTQSSTDYSTGDWSDTSNKIVVTFGTEQDGTTPKTKTIGSDGVLPLSIVTRPIKEASVKVLVETSNGLKYRKVTDPKLTLLADVVKAQGIGLNPVTEAVHTDDGWYLVTDASELFDGDEIRIACPSYEMIAGDFTVANEKITDYLIANAATFTPETYAQLTGVDSENRPNTFTLQENYNGSFVLVNEKGKLGTTGVKKMSYDDGLTEWTIAIADNLATISTGNDHGRILYNYNSGTNSRFLNYAFTTQTNVSMLLPHIYKKYGTPEDPIIKIARTASFSPEAATVTIDANNNVFPTLSFEPAEATDGVQTWTSSNTDVATVNATTGEVTLVSDGTTTISVEIAETDTYQPCSAEYALTVKPAPVQGLDIIDNDFAGNPNKYSDWSNTSDGSGKTYAGYSTTQSNKNNMQFKSNDSVSGIVVTASTTGKVAAKITVEWDTETASGRTLDVYGKTSAYSAVSELYSSKSDEQGTMLGSITYGTSTELVIDGSYEYIGLRSKSGAQYIVSITIQWKDDLPEYKACFKNGDAAVEEVNGTVGVDFTAPTLSIDDGLTPSVTYGSSDTDVATVDAESGAVTLKKKGDAIITATLDGDANHKTTKVPYTLHVANVLSSIEITTEPTKKSYYVGDKADYSGIAVTANYNDNTSAEIAVDKLNFSGFDSSEAVAEQAITVSYTENEVTKTDSYTVEIVAATTLYDIDVTGAADANGNSVTVDGVKDKAEEGDEITLNVTLATGYKLTSLKVNEAEHSSDVAGGKYTFTMPAAAVTVTASFDNHYTVTLGSTTNGSFTVNDKNTSPVSIAYGTTVNLEATPSDGYVFKTWTVEGATVASATAKSTSFTMPANDVTVNAEFEQPKDATYFYESFKNCNGTGGNDGSWSGSIASSTLTADNEGWTFANGNGANKCAKFGSSSAQGSAMTPSINISTSTAKLMFKAGAWNGSSEGTTLNLSATGALLGMTSVTLTKGAWNPYEVEITNISGPVTIKFEAANKSSNRFFLDEVYVYYGTEPSTPKHAVSLGAHTNGEITATIGGETLSLPAQVEEGTSISITATPSSNYKFDSWSITGATPAGATASTTITVGSSDITIGATFTEDSGGGQGGTAYTKVTSAPADWSGTYIIAYVNGTSAYVYNGTDSAANNGASTTISNNEIAYSNYTEIEIAKMEGGYSLKVVGGTNNGKYLSGGTSNGTTFNTNAVANSISMNTDGTVKINNNTSTSFQFNSASDQQRFRYFKSAQKGVTLFKK